MTKQEAIIEKELKITDFLKGKFKYDNYGQNIWLVEPNGNHQKIADIRGWGRIQHFFMDKKGKLDEKKAGEFQDKCGQWVADALNKALESELQSLESQEVITTDEDIENASIDYYQELDYRLIRNGSKNITDAYKQGAKDYRDNNIYISPVSKERGENETKNN